MNLLSLVPPGVVNGKNLGVLYNYARKNKYAYPAVNVVGTHSVNATLEAAKEMNSPVIIQLSYGGASFFIGKGTSLSADEMAINGAIAAAKYIHHAAKLYGIPVILHTDHAAKKLLPWIDGLLKAGEEHFSYYGKPLFSSHMLDLSEEPLHENINISAIYFKKMAKMDMGIEIELGCTGGEEDGIDNTQIDNSLLYTQPEDVAYAFSQLAMVDYNFTIAASFGNVHGVYKPGNVKLTPEILKNSQIFVAKTQNLPNKSPINFVFHGGSGSSLSEINESIEYGVVKMNIDTDTQWASWKGIHNYYNQNKDFLQSQIGSSFDPFEPNKKYYDPRVWLREMETNMKERLIQTFHDLNCVNRYKSS